MNVGFEVRLCRSRLGASVSAGVLAGCGLLLLAGCKPHAERPGDAGAGNAPAAVPASVPIDPAQTGSVSGTVRFRGKAPERLHIDMSQDPVCSMTGGDNLAEQYVVHDGKLANVYVYVKAGPPAAMGAAAPSAAPVVLDQKGCRYVPHVIAVMRGGSVEFRNSDATMHNIHTMPTVVGNETIDVSQGPGGKPVVRRFAVAETMLPVRCNNHPWMNAFINVAPTPFFAVSDAEGHFEIPGLPAGKYTLAAVHEKLDEQDVEVEVAAHGSTEAVLSFGPAAK